MESDLFHVALHELQALAAQTHDNSNVLCGLLFAEERGWLSPIDAADKERRTALDDRLQRQLETQLHALAAAYPHPLRSYLQEGIEVFTALVERPESVPTTNPRAEQHRFDCLVARSLLPAWQALQRGGQRQGGFSLCWALEVGEQLRHRYLAALRAA